MMFLKVAPKNIQYVWPDCEKYFKSLPQWRISSFDTREVSNQIKSGHCTLHAVFNKNGNMVGACVTHPETYPNGVRSLFVDAFCGDDFNAWMSEGFKALEDFARESGCNAVEYLGRKGFSKLDPSYQEDGRLYVKMLEGKNE